MYVAVPVTDQGRVVGVARVALPLTTVEASINKMALTIVGAVAVAALLVIVVAALLARMITRPVRRITTAAEAIASGESGPEDPGAFQRRDRAAGAGLQQHVLQRQECHGGGVK